MRVAEVATALGVSRSAVRKAITRGALEATPVAGQYVVTRREVERYRRENLLSRHGESREREAYLAVAGELRAMPLEDVDPFMVALGRAYARRRRQKWPPRAAEEAR